jgi:hypothetical protein
LDNIGEEITMGRSSAITAGAVFGAVFGFAISAGASMMGFSIEQWLRLVPKAQEIYVAGMLDAMGELRLYHPLHTYRELVRADACITKTKVTAAQLAQGMANYAKLNPAAFSTGVAGMDAPFVSGGLSTYLEFICPDLFNKAAYDRDDAMTERYPIDPKDAR